MNLTRLKELSAAGYPVALAPEQMLELVNELEALRARVDHWKQVAEDCAVAGTKTEACEILQKALSADGDTGR